MTITLFVIAMQILHYMPTHSHFIPHRQMCLASIYCNHTRVATCGKERNDNTIRTFLDTCDMFEYNCDNRKEYFEIDLDNCHPNENENTVNDVIPNDIDTTNSANKVLDTLNRTEIIQVTETTTEVKTTLATTAATSTLPLVEITTPPPKTTTASIQTDKTFDIDCTRNTNISNDTLPNIYPHSNAHAISSVQPTTLAALITTQSTTSESTITQSTTTESITMQSMMTESTTTQSTTTESTTKQSTITKEITTGTTTVEVATALPTTILCPTAVCFCCPGLTQITGKPPELKQSTATQYVVTTESTTQLQSTVPIKETITAVSNTTEPIKPMTEESTTMLTTTTTDLTTVRLPINVTTEVTPDKRAYVNKTKNDTNHTDSTSSLSTKCNKTFPPHCKLPVTWETTHKGESRDFYQILRARFGNKITVLKDTTHWAKQKIVDDSKRNKFVFGRHNDT